MPSGQHARKCISVGGFCAESNLHSAIRARQRELIQTNKISVPEQSVVGKVSRVWGEVMSYHSGSSFSGLVRLLLLVISLQFFFFIFAWEMFLFLLSVSISSCCFKSVFLDRLIF